MLLKADIARWWRFHGDGVTDPAFLDLLRDRANSAALVDTPGYLGKTLLIDRERGEILGFTIWNSAESSDASHQHAARDAARFQRFPSVGVDPLTVYEVVFAYSRMPGQLPTDAQVDSMRARVATVRGGTVASDATLETLDRYFAHSEAQRPGELITCILCDRDRSILIVVSLFADQHSHRRADTSAAESFATIAAATGAEADVETYDVIAYDRPLTWLGA